MAKVLTQVEALRIASKAKTAGMKSTHFIVEVRGADLVVSLLNGKFKATYYKPLGRRNLILRERTKTDDEALVVEAFQAAVAKARELGWIVSGFGRRPFYVILPMRRFPPPWTVQRLPGGFKVVDASGQSLGC